MDRLDNIMQGLRANAAQNAGDAAHDTTTRSRHPQPRTPARGTAVHSVARLPQGGGKRVLLVVAVVIVAVLVLGLLSGLARGGAHTTMVPSAAAKVPVTAPARGFMQAPTPLDWKPIIEQLDIRRGRLFMDREAVAILQVDAVPSSAGSTDEALVNALRKAHAHLREYPMRVISVAEQYVTVGEEEPRAMLTVVDELGAYDVVDDRGRVLRTVPARGRARWNVELQNRGPVGWVYVSAIRTARQ